ncbi:MAG TPA: DNA-binding response regulator [Eoetvoesiella sp.]
MASFTLLPESGAHILIVDDRPDELRQLMEIFRGHGLRLSIAFDGAQGYDRALALMPDAILLETRTPKMDGFALTRMLKANPVTARIPILFLTVSGEVNARLEGLRAGGVDYITKPFSAEEVFERVNIHLRLSGAIAAGNDLLADGIAKTGTGEYGVLVCAAQKYLSSRLSNPPRLSNLALTFGVTERRLSAAFRHCLGITVFEFLRQERMRKAKRLLVQTTLGIAAIAEEVGFSSAANFSTAFRDYTGSSPSAFRTQESQVVVSSGLFGLHCLF